MKRVAWFLGVNALATSMSLVMAEAVVRAVGPHAPGGFSNIRYENDPLTGPWALPSQTVFTQTDCFQLHDAHTNRFGMRDRERSLAPNGPRIALIGDSITQGLQVRDDETVSRQLERSLGGGVEVLNFGVSSTGTAVQLLQYRAHVRPFHPDAVLLMFWVQNDAWDNLPQLKRLHDPQVAVVSPYLLLDASGQLSHTAEPGRWRRTSPIVSALSSSSVGRWIVHWRRRQSVASAAQRGPAPAEEPAQDVAELYERAWRTTEAIIARFDEEVRSDGAHFGVVVIPSGFETLSAEGRVNDETRQAVSRLQALGSRAGFPVLDLSPALEGLAQRGAPFWYPCDGHWNALGHAESARAIRAFLLTQGWAHES